MKKVMLLMLVLVCVVASNVNATITFQVDKDSYDMAAGDAIVASWTGSQGSKNDWVGIYHPGETPGNVSSTWWKWCPAGATEGSLTFGGWPTMPAGDYDIYFFDIGDDVANGWYNIGGSDTFTVVPEPVTLSLLGLGGLALLRRKRNA